MARALLIIDFQNDFCLGGKLPIEHGDEVIPILNAWMAVAAEKGVPVFASRDWHPIAHVSFKDQGGPWPPHCVQGSEGAELHPSVDRTKVDAVVNAGYRPELEGYSGFEETELAEVLRRNAVDELTVVGLATDYCVRSTALDALREGFQVTVDRAGIRGIDVEPGDSERALEELSDAGASLT